MHTRPGAEFDAYLSNIIFFVRLYFPASIKYR